MEFENNTYSGIVIDKNQNCKEKSFKTFYLQDKTSIPLFISDHNIKLVLFCFGLVHYFDLFQVMIVK